MPKPTDAPQDTPDDHRGGWPTPDEVAAARAARAAVPAPVVAAFLTAANDAYGYGMDEYDARAILAAALPTHDRAVRARIAGEYRAAADQAQADSGEGLDPLAEAITRDCRNDSIAPAVFDDPRNIAAAAYRHLAARLEGETR